jgi:predicted DNA-binding transcriptional regulator YafY
MRSQRRASENVRRVGREALRLLQAHDVASQQEVARKTRTSLPTAKRALEWLRDQGADLEYVAAHRAWRLTDRTFALPLADPTVDDLLAALIATGLLAELGQEGAATRARALFNELAGRIEDGKAKPIRATSLRVTQTTSVVPNPQLMLRLLRAAGRSVVRIKSVSAWTRASSVHEFEPWQVWVHDGIPYVRGFSKRRNAARTFALANIESVEVIPGVRPHARVPDDPWAGEDPRYGIDNDRPGRAVIRLRGAVGRWVSSLRWHPHQKDTWLDGDLLERQIDYRSCRELARRVVCLGDGLDDVAPRELREEVLRLARGALGACSE